MKLINILKRFKQDNYSHKIKESRTTNNQLWELIQDERIFNNYKRVINRN